MHRRLLSSVAPSIRARLWLLVIAVTVPSALLAGWLIWQSYRQERVAMERHVLDAARAISLVLEAELRERVAVLQGLSTSTPLIRGDLVAFRERAERLVNRDGEWVILADTTGRQLVNTRWPDDTDLSRLELAPDFDGAQWAGFYVSNLVVSEREPRYSVYVAIRTRVGAGEGVLCLAMTPTALAAALMREELMQAGVMAVMDRERTVVTRSRQPERFIGHKATTNVQAATAEANEGVVDSVTLDGYRSIAAFKVLPEMGWLVVAAGHKEELIAPAKRMVAIALAVTGLVGAFVLVVVLWVSRATAAVADTLVADTQVLAQGGHVEARRLGLVEADTVSQALAETSRELAARQAALAQARDEAVAASRAKDEFLAALSHELRTPLNPVLLLASEAARDPAQPAAVREVFATIERNVLHEARLIDDLLDLTRIGSGKLSLRLESLDFDAAVRAAVETLRPTVAEKRIDLRVRLAAEGTRVQGDSVRLQQVLTNVLGNAAKFTPESGIIMVKTRRMPGPAELAGVCCEIADSGIGMSAEEVGRVFGRFVQGEHARNGGHSRFGGLGLGLAISKSLVELHGGRIEAASAGPGRGSTFTICLPVEAPPAPPLPGTATMSPIG